MQAGLSSGNHRRVHSVGGGRVAPCEVSELPSLTSYMLCGSCSVLDPSQMRTVYNKNSTIFSLPQKLDSATATLLNSPAGLNMIYRVEALSGDPTLGYWGVEQLHPQSVLRRQEVASPTGRKWQFPKIREPQYRPQIA